MYFQELYTMLRQNFRYDNNEIIIPEINVRIKNIPFHSDYDFEDLDNLLPRITDFKDYRFRDHKIKENSDFVYPVFLPGNKIRYDRAIILLHGLNEKNWNKYLPWGQYLSEKTKIPVILFPISFHMNRAPAEWSDPIKIQRYQVIRKAIFRDIQESTFINVAISTRLTDWPERFFLSGYQSLNDLIHLIRDIRDGNHPLFNKNTTVDFFAYSISILLVQCLIIVNPENLLDHSKFFFFAGGSFFADMNGISRYIMDSKAHEALKYYYVHQMEEVIKSEKKLISILDLTQFGRAFRSMMAPDRFRNMRESMFRFFNKDIFILGLKNDRVIPCISIAETFTGVKNKIPSNMEICDPPYPYYHENPFPVKLTQYKFSINNFFERVFTRATEFLTYYT
jgi:hypothetical protein